MVNLQPFIKKAGEATASSADPYGETGFTSKNGGMVLCHSM